MFDLLLGLKDYTLFQLYPQLASLDESRDPVLYLQAIHNEVYLLVDLERYPEARLLLWSNLGRYERHGGMIDRLKLRGLWGLINAGMGKLDEAARHDSTAVFDPTA
jgi:hypothetical protein